MTAGSGNNNDFAPGFVNGAIFSELAARQIATYPNKKQMRAYLSEIAATNPDAYIGKARSPIFMQFARDDAYISPAMALDYFGHAAEPKRAAWYLGGHELNDPQARLDRTRFLADELRLSL